MGYYSRVGLGLTLLDVSENDQIRNIQYESCIYNRLVEHGHRILLSSPDPSFLGVPWMPPCCASSGFQQCFRRVSPVSHYYLMTFWEKLWSKLAPWWTKSSMAENRLAFVKLSMPFHAIRITGMAWFYMIIYIYIWFYRISIHFTHFFPMQSLFFIDFHRPSVNWGSWPGPGNKRPWMDPPCCWRWSMRLRASRGRPGGWTVGPFSDVALIA